MPLRGDCSLVSAKCRLSMSKKGIPEGASESLEDGCGKGREDDRVAHTCSLNTWKAEAEGQPQLNTSVSEGQNSPSCTPPQDILWDSKALRKALG